MNRLTIVSLVALLIQTPLYSGQQSLTCNANEKIGLQNLLKPNESSQIEKLNETINNLQGLQKKFPNQLTAQDGFKHGILIGAATYVGIKAAEMTPARSVVRDLLFGSAAEMSLGAAAGTAILLCGGYVWFGKEIQMILGFKGKIAGVLKEFTAIKKTIDELKTNQQELQDTLNQAREINERVLDALPAVAEVSGDNARLAETTQLCVQEIQKCQRLFEQFIRLLPEDQQNELKNINLETIEEIQKKEKRKKALKAYNHLKVLHRKRSLSEVPTDWLESHGYADLVPTTESASSN